MSEPATQQDINELEAATDEAIATCGGDARAAVMALLVANAFWRMSLRRQCRRSHTATARAGTCVGEGKKMTDRPTKTFGLETPTDLYRKLLHDIERLRSARSSGDARYAAFDCAVDAWHLVDWTLHFASDAAYERLSGFTRGGPSRKGKLTVEASFKDMQEDRLPALRFCHMIANSVKHREVRTDLMPNLWTGSTGTLSWSEPEKDTGERSVTSVSLLTYVTVDGERYKAVELFEDMAEQWRTFLIEEVLFEFRPEQREVE